MPMGSCANAEGQEMSRLVWIAILITVVVPARAKAQLLEYGPPYTVNGGFSTPTGLGNDEAHGRVLIADTGNRRVKYTTILALTGTPSWADLGYVADPSMPGALDGPQGV